MIAGDLNYFFSHRNTGKALGSLCLQQGTVISQVKSEPMAGLKPQRAPRSNKHWCLVKSWQETQQFFLLCCKKPSHCPKGCFNVKGEWGATLWSLYATTVLMPFRELLVLSLGTFLVGWRQWELWDWDTALGTGLQLLLKSKRSAE